MQRFLTLVVVVGLGALLWWVWSGDIQTSFFNVETAETVEENTSIKTSAKRKPAVKGLRRTEKVSVKTSEKEIYITIEANENGVFLTEINGKEVLQKVSSKEVFSLDVKLGILSFWEIDPESSNLKFKSINLTEFVKTLE